MSSEDSKKIAELESELVRTKIKLQASRESVFPISVERDEYKTQLREALGKITELTEELSMKQSAINDAIATAWQWNTHKKSILVMLSILRREVVTEVEDSDKVVSFDSLKHGIDVVSYSEEEGPEYTQEFYNSAVGPNVDAVEKAALDFANHADTDFDTALDYLVSIAKDRHS